MGIHKINIKNVTSTSLDDPISMISGATCFLEPGSGGSAISPIFLKVTPLAADFIGNSLLIGGVFARNLGFIGCRSALSVLIGCEWCGNPLVA